MRGRCFGSSECAPCPHRPQAPCRPPTSHRPGRWRRSKGSQTPLPVPPTRQNLDGGTMSSPAPPCTNVLAAIGHWERAQTHSSPEPCRGRPRWGAGIHWRWRSTFGLEGTILPTKRHCRSTRLWIDRIGGRAGRATWSPKRWPAPQRGCNGHQRAPCGDAKSAGQNQNRPTWPWSRLHRHTGSNQSATHPSRCFLPKRRKPRRSTGRPTPPPRPPFDVARARPKSTPKRPPIPVA